MKVSSLMPGLKQRFISEVKHQLVLTNGGVDHTAPMIDAAELKRRLVIAMDSASPRVKSSDLARACEVSPQAVHGWRTKGLIDKKFLPTIARLTNQPIEYFVGASPFDQEAALGLQAEELKAITSLREALPEWRRYVLQLAMADRAAQTILLRTMLNAVPDAKVEKALGTPVAPVAKKPGTHR